MEITSNKENISDIFWLCAFPVFSIIYPFMIVIMARKNYTTDDFIKETQHYNIKDNEIEIKTKSSSVIIVWDSIYKIKETKNYFFIYIAKNKAFLLNKNAFLNKVDIKNFKEVITKNIMQKKFKLIKKA